MQATQPPTSRTRNGVIAGAVGGLLVGLLIGTLMWNRPAEGDVGVGPTFTAPIYSYANGENSGPEVVCFEREINCGVPILADPEATVSRGDMVTATQVTLRTGEGSDDVTYGFYLRLAP